MTLDRDLRIGIGELHLVLDLANERPTLGGALVLRQEGELLAGSEGFDSAVVHVTAALLASVSFARLAEVVFGSSALKFRLTDDRAGETAWPPAAERARSDFSHFSYSRVASLHAVRGLAPRLRWDRRVIERARKVREQFTGRLICLHLKNVAPFAVEESNADPAVWAPFLAGHARPGKLDFLLLGDDEPPRGIVLGQGVRRAAALGMDLATQLALVSVCDGFLGMASGVCAAANFSGVPYVIFKHPAHHRLEMERELGNAEAFAFAESRQRLWRRAVTANDLDEAMDLITT